MMIHSCTTEDLNDVALMGMEAAIRSLINEKIITKEDGDRFLDTHIVLMTDENKFFQRIIKYLNLQINNEREFGIIAFKVDE